MPFIRSVAHGLWMLLTVMPWAIIMLVASTWRRGVPLYWMAARWLGWAMDGARVILVLQHRITGWDTRPLGEKSPAILAKSTGKAVFVSGLTTVAGFGSLMLAQHQGIVSLGFVMSVGVSASMLAGLVTLPALLVWLRPSGEPAGAKRETQRH